MAQRSYVADGALQELGAPTTIPGPFNPAKPQRYRLVYQAPDREAFIVSGSHTPLRIQIGDDEYVGTTPELPTPGGKFLLLQVDPNEDPIMAQATDALHLLLGVQDVVRQGNQFQIAEDLRASASDLTPWLLAGMGESVHVTINTMIQGDRIVTEDLHLVSGSRRVKDALHFADFDHAPGVEPPTAQELAPSPCDNPSVTLPSNEAIFCSR